MRPNRAAAGAHPASPPSQAHPAPSASRSGESPAKVGNARGRPRNPRIDREVVAAALKVLREGGYRAVTLDGIARRVKRARTSLYRRWPSKRHLVAYTVLSEMGASPAADTGTLRGDLQATVGTLLRAFSGPLRHALPGLVADMAHDVKLAETLRREVLDARRQSVRAAFARAQARGEARSGPEIELLLDMLTAPFYYRALFGHAPITRRMAHDVVEYLLRIVAPLD
jgi:AcrR family transcriptional regulator